MTPTVLTASTTASRPTSAGTAGLGLILWAPLGVFGLMLIVTAILGAIAGPKPKNQD